MATRNKLHAAGGRNAAPPEAPPADELPDFLLAGENKSAWEQLLERWHRNHPSDDPALIASIRQAAESEWEMLRAETTFRKVLQKLTKDQNDMADWSVDTLKHYRLYDRIRCDAERRLRVIRNDLARRWRAANRESAALPVRAAKEKTEKTDSQTAPAPALKLLTMPAPFSQSVHVETRNGVTHTIFNPESEFLLRMVSNLGKPGQNIHRTIHFPEPLPTEYGWAAQDGDPAPQRVRWILPPARFEEEMLREQQSGHGHLSPDLTQYWRETLAIA